VPDAPLASDQFSSALPLPGDSFPHTNHTLAASSIMLSDVSDLGLESANGTDSDRELLRRLTQSQARMEQIKRMLVAQRGIIVQVSTDHWCIC
jgi:hypothetical protein